MAELQSDTSRPHGPPGGLTEKQCDVLDLLIAHMTSKEMARELGISPHTVDQRLMFAREKLGARNRSELASIYRDLVKIGYRPAESAHPEPDESGGTREAREMSHALEEGGEPREAPSHVVPASFDGPGGTLFRIGSMMGIALLLVLVILGSFALYQSMAQILGR